MSKRSTFYEELFDVDGIRLADDDNTNVENGRRLLGAILVGQMDVTIESALKVIAGINQHTENSPLHAKQQELCEVFASMSESQRDAARTLVRDNTSLMLFSICSKLDQFPGFDVAISLRTLPTDDPSMREFVVASGDHEELHASYFDWIEDFSDHVTEGD